LIGPTNWLGPLGAAGWIGATTLLAGFGAGEGPAATGWLATGEGPDGTAVGLAAATVGDAGAGEAAAAVGDGGAGVRVGGMVIPPLLHAVNSTDNTSTRVNGNRPPFQPGEGGGAMQRR
jgi:hypothetical protein